MVSHQSLGKSEEVLSEHPFGDMQKTTGSSQNGITEGEPCLAHLPSIIKCLCGRGKEHCMFFISALTRLSALSHTTFLHPAQDATAHITKGAGKLAACPGSAPGLGWNHPLGPGGSHRMTLKWEFQPTQLGQGCWPKGWTGTC